MSSSFPDAGQIRAALGLLRWENEELARACRITPQSVSNIKRGATRPQPRILSAIRRVFEAQGIEFTDNSGVRLKPEGVEILQSHEGFIKFYRLLYDRLVHYGGTVYVSGADENLFVKHLGEDAPAHIARMTDLVQARKDISMKILVREGDTNFPAAAYASYRWQSREHFSTTAFYVFTDYLALISFHGKNAPRVILIHSAIFAEAYRLQFMEQWKYAAIPPKQVR